ncbi:MAG TPA: FAD-dependent oxidoreductase [Gemmatimonadales bacterium]|jgi:L-2-hydroxyglutarate oxidase LhgO
MSTAGTADFLIIGGGVIGLTIALELKRRHPQAAVTLIEKENDCGVHASSRNSGVLHAGFYYTADTLKARFTKAGNRAWTAYCEARGLRINRCGKLVVARNAGELPVMDELVRRARASAIELQELTPEEARLIEPRVRTYERALFSPTTSSVAPAEVMAAVVADARALGITIRTSTAYRGAEAGSVRTSAGRVAAGYVINAAGLYADRIARDYGFGERYRILPFKGLYLYGNGGSRPPQAHVYPVPDLRQPFLGVHFTLTAAGDVKIGPTAIPAFWRQHYGGLANFDLGECAEILARQAGLLFSNAGDFRSLAWNEVRKYSRRRIVELAAELVAGTRPAQYRKWGPAGIRAQLLDLETKTLDMDFRCLGDDRSFHVLNAVSPGFTCAMPFAAYVVDRIEELAR